MKKLTVKSLSIFLSLLFITQTLPLNAFSLYVNECEVSETDEIHINETNDEHNMIIDSLEENIELRDEHTKHFRQSDGSYIAVSYIEPIHYEKNGEWLEIDNTITNVDSEMSLSSNSTDSFYGVVNRDTPILFPKNINKDKISIYVNEKIIEFAPINSQQRIDEEIPAETFPKENTQTLEETNCMPSVQISNSDSQKKETFSANTKNSAIQYENVFENASIIYEITPSSLKESIVVTQESDNYVYDFSIDFDGGIPVKQDSGEICVFENSTSKEPFAIIAAPYMFDSNGDISYDVEMELTQVGKDHLLTVIADEEWINDESRTLPITIDPTFILDLGKNHIHDAHVNQNYPDRNYKLDYQLEVGKNGNNVYRTYIQYDLPDLPDCSVVTNAELTFVQNWARNIENTELYLNVYECGASWNEDSITWNNQPISDISSATIVDYTNYVNGMSAEYNLDVTKIVKNWYENGNNYGLMLASSNESVEEKTSFYSAENWFSGIDSLHYPIIIIQYVNNNGIESYWDYETVSLDKSGTAYINTYNGGLTYLHEDASTNGLLAPVSVSHVYSSDERVVSGEYRNMNFGNGFKLNLVEIIEVSSVSGYPYKYIDADGTVHYFKNGTSNNQYIYEFDPLTVLTKNDSGFTMTFADGTRKHFDSDGYLTQITDNNSNIVSITYSEGKIVNVTDGGGKSITFTYNTNNTLKTVVDTAGRITNYTYSNGKLTKIIYPDGAQTVYSYNSNGLLKNITSFSNEVIDLEYKTVNCVNRKIYRVSSVALKGNNQEHNIYDKLTFIYQPNGTVITNEKGDKNELAFDDSGRLISCYSNGKTITVAEYNNNGNTNNKPSFISNTFTPSENLGRRNKNTHYYYVNEAGNHNIYNERCKERLYNQTECIKVGVKPGYGAHSNYVYRYTLPHEEGATYTYTAYVNIVDTLEEGSVYLKAKAENSDNETIAEFKGEEITTTNNGWVMLSLTLTIPEDTLDLIISYGLFEGVGTVYLEEINYEKADAPGRVNLVYNSSFDCYDHLTPFEGWGGNYNEFFFGVNPTDGTKAAKIIGRPNYDKQLIQDIDINGKAGDVIVFGGSAQALCSASGNDGYRFFGIKLFFKNANEALGDPICAPFNTDAYDVMQHIMASAVAPADYDEIEIWLCYDYEINSVIFDDIFLYRDYFGTDYVYDGNGRLSTMVSDSGQSIAYTYTGNNITGITAAYNGTVTHTASYTYDSSNNLLSAVGNDGVRQTYTYPSSGNKGLPVSVTVSDTSGENTSTTSYTYCDNYNYLESVTDPSGATVEYVYDNGETITKGLVTSVIDPNGNVTNYTYNSYNDELLSISNPSQELGTPTTEFTYTNGKVTGISGDEAEYVLSYDMFGRPTQTQGSGVTLMSCTYNEDSTLNTFTFGNGSHIEYSYNEDRQVTAEKYNGIDTFEYDYNTQGQLGRYTDLENNFTWEYFYDLAGRPVSSERSDGTKVAYAYDSKGNLSDFNVSFNGVPVSEMQYGYDALNRPVSVTMTAMEGSPSQTYSYDSLGRTQSISGAYSGNNKVTSNYSYLVNNGNQTGRVSSVDFVKTTSSGSTALLPTLSYTYDANGNITHIYEGDTLKAKYYYDGLNRLVREDNGYTGKTVVYSYSSGGNILSKTEYVLTNGTSLGTPTDIIEYQYANASIPGGVTSYDGQQITYDVSGNPIVYRGYGMEWDKGKRLTSIMGTDVSMVCNYDSSGMRTWMVLGDDYYEFIYVGTMLVEQTINGDPMDFFYTASGAPYGFTYGGENYFYLLNLQGDVIGIYDSDGNVVVQYVYDSWGKLISITGELANTIGVLNPLRYRGYYYDTNTGLYYLQSRYYDPETGRFVNADTLIVAGNDYIQGTNMFAYCLNNPVMYVDPTGYANEKLAAAIVTIFGCIIYINDYAEKNGMDINALSDFLGRTIDEDDSIYWVRDVLCLGVSILSGDDWWNSVYGGIGMLSTLKDVMKFKMPSLFSPKGAISFFADITIDMITEYYNPLNSNVDLITALSKHTFIASGDLAIAYMALEIGAGIAASGHPFIGAAVGGALYYLGSNAWDELSKDL